MYSEEKIREACSVNFIEFMKAIHPEHIEFQNGNYRDTNHDSLVFYENGFYRHSNRTGGNQIIYLKVYLNYDFPNAVKELLNYSKANRNGNLIKKPTDNQCKKFYKPIENRWSKSAIYAYLMDRGISKDTVDSLYEDGLLYPAIVKNNGNSYCCFANEELNFYILRNTQEAGIQKLVVSENQGGYWYFSFMSFASKYFDLKKFYEHLIHDTSPYPTSIPVFVCEAPIDAISLYEFGKVDDAVYTAMGGLKEVALKQIQERFKDNQIILAVDSDNAGNRFCMEHPELQRIIPDGKDWNEMLIKKLG